MVFFCCELTKGPCPGHSLVCVVSLPKTSNQKLLSSNWTRPKHLSSNRLYKLELQVLLFSRHLLFPLNNLYLPAFLLSPQVYARPLTNLCAFLGVSLDTMVYSDVNDYQKDIDERFTILPSHPFTLPLLAPQQHVIWWHDMFEYFHRWLHRAFQMP